jgi:hypothetical protein
MYIEHQHSLKEVLKDVVDEFRWKEKLNETKIRQVWSQKMGATINNYTKEVTLRKDILLLIITSAPLKQELSYDKEKIKTMLNTELGGEYIREVIIK